MVEKLWMDREAGVGALVAAGLCGGHRTFRGERWMR